jgi:hypothetical protein
MKCFAVACIFLSQTNLYLISVYAEQVPCVFHVFKSDKRVKQKQLTAPVLYLEEISFTTAVPKAASDNFEP